MSEEDKAAVRKIALEVIADYRDRGCPSPSRSARICCRR
jgi:4-hydroxyacetophenone monooxygenase